MNKRIKRAFLSMRSKLAPMDNESGGVLIMVAISFGVLVSAIALSTELSNYANAKSRFIQAVDEATLAAAASNSDNPLAYGTEYLRANMNLQAANFYGDVLRSGNMTVTNFTITPNADRSQWDAVADATLQTSFGSLLGVGNLTLHHKASVAWDKTSTSEIVGMVDISGFSCTRVQRTQQADNTMSIDFTADRSCTKLHMMNEALKNITSIGVNYASADGQVTNPVYKVGIVPFSYKVKLPNPQNLPSILTAGEDGFSQFGGGNRYFQYTADAENGNIAPLPSVIPLTWVRNAADKSALLAKIDGLVSSDNKEFNRPFMVRPTLGAMVAALMLDPDYHNLYGGEMPAAFHTAKNDKIVIMLTDVGHLGCCFTNVEGDFSKHYVYSYGQDHDDLLRSDGIGTVCTELRNQGVEVYAILFDVKAQDAGANGNQILDGYKACATDSSHYFEVQTGDTETLNRITSVVGRAIMKLKLIK